MNQVRDYPRILIVDDNPEISELITEIAEELGICADFVSDYQSFKRKYEENVYTALVLDIIMPDKDGIEYLKSLAERECTAPVGMMSGYDAGILQTARRYGEGHGLAMGDVLRKPFDNSELRFFLASLVGVGSRKPAAPNSDDDEESDLTGKHEARS